MVDAQTCQHVAEVMGREAESVSRLLEVLEHEAQALGDHDGTVLQESVQRQQELMIELEQLATERLKLLVASGFSGDKEGFQGFLKAAGEAEGKPLEQMWSALQEQLRNCRDRNQLNGALLEATRRNTQQVLSILLGTQEPATELYDKRGAARSSFGRRSHTKA